MNLINEITKEYQKNDIPKFHVGDTVKVHIKIKEGARERIQIFEGFVLKKQNGGVSETFTVRRISSGVGVEKTFPLHSPRIAEEQWEDYKAKFFIPRRSRNKSGFTINTETLTILRNVLRDTKAETTLTAYIENILINHLKTHQELINEIADKQKLKNTLYL